jgi:hypothetical protein
MSITQPAPQRESDLIRASPGPNGYRPNRARPAAGHRFQAEAETPILGQICSRAHRLHRGLRATQIWRP